MESKKLKSMKTVSQLPHNHRLKLILPLEPMQLPLLLRMPLNRHLLQQTQLLPRRHRTQTLIQMLLQHRQLKPQLTPHNKLLRPTAPRLPTPQLQQSQQRTQLLTLKLRPPQLLPLHLTAASTTGTKTLCRPRIRKLKCQELKVLSLISRGPLTSTMLPSKSS